MTHLLLKWVLSVPVSFSFIGPLRRYWKCRSGSPFFLNGRFSRIPPGTVNHSHHAPNTLSLVHPLINVCADSFFSCFCAIFLLGLLMMIMRSTWDDFRISPLQIFLAWDCCISSVPNRERERVKTVFLRHDFSCDFASALGSGVILIAAVGSTRLIGSF